MTYEELLAEADSLNLITKEKPLKAHRGRIKNNRIAIKSDMPTAEKACVLAEELGHYHTTTGDILNQSDVSNRKQERKARLWAYNKMITIEKLISAYEYGCNNAYEVAEHLGVTEEFLKETIRMYEEQFGKYCTIRQYKLIFNDGCLYIMRAIN